MKKFALPMGVLAILIAGVLLLMNQKEEVVPTADKEKVVSDVQTEDDNISEVIINKKTSKVSSKEVNNEKKYINTITGENVPAGFYDEILADSYTYNNPKPIPEEWITKPAEDDYPATIDYYKFIDEASESQTLPGTIGSKTLIPDYMYGYSGHSINIYFSKKYDKISNKSDFTNWFSNNYSLNFQFIQKNKSYNWGGQLWSIYITEGDVNDIKSIMSDIKKNYDVDINHISLYLPKYRHTEELKRLKKTDSNARIF